MGHASVDPDDFDAFEAAGWEEKADAYERWFGDIAGRPVEPLLNAAAAGVGTRVLDVATGPGWVDAPAWEPSTVELAGDRCAGREPTRNPRSATTPKTHTPTVGRALSLLVLTLDGDRISHITRFAATNALPHFGLPERVRRCGCVVHTRPSITTGFAQEASGETAHAHAGIVVRGPSLRSRPNFR